MHFLADEDCDALIVRALRNDGHDVLSISELSPRAEDADVMRLGVRESRIVVTEDKDFGRLVYAQGQKTAGVILLRYPYPARRQISRDVIKLLREKGEKLAGCFVTIQPGRIRIGRAPET